MRTWKSIFIFIALILCTKNARGASPTVSTSVMESVSVNSAIAAGNVISNGGMDITARGVCYVEGNDTPSITDNIMPAISLGTGAYTCTLVGLKPNTLYSLRAFATNLLGTSYGYQLTFTTGSEEYDITYTGTARQADGTIVTNQYIRAKFKVFKTTNLVVADYIEEFDAYVDQYGTYSITVGQGEVNGTGGFDDLDITANDYVVRIRIDEAAPFNTIDFRTVDNFRLLDLMKKSQTVSATAGSEDETMVAPFIDMKNRDGWTFTGQSEFKGELNRWTTMSADAAPSARSYYSSVWTGEELLIWGGSDGSKYNDGYKYNPTTDTWTAMSTVNAPDARSSAGTVWTGTEMIIWGGYSSSNTMLGDGKRYNPTTDTWTDISSTNAPAARDYNSCVWTGTEMIIWAGDGPEGTYHNDGARYNPATDTWTTMTTTNAPDIRIRHATVWTGEKMIVWGGMYSGGYYDDGGIYDPIEDSWTSITTSGAPAARADVHGVWTGEEMIVWGGRDCSTCPVESGGKYNPETNSWSSVSTSSAPLGNCFYAIAWTGKEMIIWGGQDYSGGWYSVNNGNLYNPETDLWESITTTNAPSARYSASYVQTFWSGSELIIWGNGDSSNYNTGARLGKGLSIYWYKKSGAVSGTSTEPAGGG